MYVYTCVFAYTYMYIYMLSLPVCGFVSTLRGYVYLCRPWGSWRWWGHRAWRSRAPGWCRAQLFPSWVAARPFSACAAPLPTRSARRFLPTAPWWFTLRGPGLRWKVSDKHVMTQPLNTPLATTFAPHRCFRDVTRFNRNISFHSLCAREDGGRRRARCGHFQRTKPRFSSRSYRPISDATSSISSTARTRSTAFACTRNESTTSARRWRGGQRMLSVPSSCIWARVSASLPSPSNFGCTWRALTTSRSLQSTRCGSSRRQSCRTSTATTCWRPDSEGLLKIPRNTRVSSCTRWPMYLWGLEWQLGDESNVFQICSIHTHRHTFSVCLFVCILECACVCRCVRMYFCARLCACVRVCARACARVFVRVFLRVCVRVCACVSVRVRVCVYVCVWRTKHVYVGNFNACMKNASSCVWWGEYQYQTCVLNCLIKLFRMCYVSIFDVRHAFKNVIICATWLLYVEESYFTMYKNHRMIVMNLQFYMMVWSSKQSLYKYTFIHRYVRMYMRMLFKWTCQYICIYIYIHIHTHTHIYIRTYKERYICTYLFTYMYI